MEPNCTNAVTDAVIVETVVAHGNSRLPESVVREAMYKNVPVKQDGMMRTIVGIVPIMIWRTESLMIPHRTEVCQYDSY